MVNVKTLENIHIFLEGKSYLYAAKFFFMTLNLKVVEGAKNWLEY